VHFCLYVQNVHVSKRDITIYVVTIYHDTSRRYWEANCTRQPFCLGTVDFPTSRLFIPAILEILARESALHGCEPIEIYESALIQYNLLDPKVAKGSR